MNNVENSEKIYNVAKNSINSLFQIYDCKNYNCQDLLRAIILFSCSAIDAILKQLIDDNLADIIEKDEGAFKKFQEYVNKKIDNNDSKYNAILLSNIFTSDISPKETLIKKLQQELKANSLQSVEEFCRVSSYFNIKIDNNKTLQLKEIFETRNQIVHEMDIIDIKKKEVVQNTRNRDKVEKYSAYILECIKYFIEEVDKKYLQDKVKFD